jgi:hypothetical protein
MERDPQVVELFAMLEEGEISPSELMADLDIMGFDGDIFDYI